METGPPQWSHHISAWTTDSLAVAAAVFDWTGRLVWANAGMGALLELEGGNDDPASFFRAPTIRALLDDQSGEEDLFAGLMTVGNGRDSGVTLLGRAYRAGDELCVIGEHDTEELNRVNRELVALNREVSTLQRQLLKKTATLERTLTELRETQAMLIQSEKMAAMGQLVAGVAHEINTPIGYVHGNLRSMKDSLAEMFEAYASLEALAERWGGEEARAEASAIRERHDIDFFVEDFDDLHGASVKGIGRVKELVEKLRRFSRLDEGELKEIDLEEAISNTLEIASAELRNRGVVAATEIGPLPPVTCYAADLSQVFLNLVLNGAQAMENGGRLTIRARAEGELVMVEFEDEGGGIPEELRERIFDPFFTTKDVGEGTGLGLSLAVKIVNGRHGGRLTVASEPGRGSTFTVSIPIRAQGAEGAAAP